MLLAVKCIAVDESSQLDGKITEQIKKTKQKTTKQDSHRNNWRGRLANLDDHCLNKNKEDVFSLLWPKIFEILAQINFVCAVV